VSRYYRIELTDKDGKPIQLASYGSQASPQPLSTGSPLESGTITSLLPDGSTNPAALNIEIDIEQMAMHIGDQRSYVRVYGLALKDVFSTNFNKQNISVKVGMAPGLPLATAAASQRGVVMKGSIWQAFGNWIGTDMTLDFVIGAGGETGVSVTGPQPWPFNWKKDQKLSDAIKDSLKNSPLSKLEQKITVSDDRTASEDQQGYYVTATEFAQVVHRLTVGQRGQNDNGVYLYNDGQKFVAADTSEVDQQGDTKEISFQDLIGQVTWYEPFHLTCKMVMRGDLEVGGWVKFKDGAVVEVTANALPNLTPTRDRDTLGILKGRFFIERIHHWGNYRQPDAMSWNTTLGLLQIGGG
jgi:hypothetical protein